MEKFGAGTGWVGADIKKKEGRKTKEIFRLIYRPKFPFLLLI